MADKKEERCDRPAMYRYTWPGKDEAYCCFQHALQIQGLANAIGHHQQLIRLEPDEVIKANAEDRTCESKVKDG